MEKNNPNKTFRATRKVTEPINITQIRAIRNQAATLKYSCIGLVLAVLGRYIMLDNLTYEQAERVIEYGDSRVKQRFGGG